MQTLIVLTATEAEPYLIANFGWINQSSFDCFFLGEVEKSAELVTDRLESAISDAEQLLATTEEGTAKGQYTAEVRAVLQQAISEARSVLQSATTQDEINDAEIPETVKGMIGELNKSIKGETGAEDIREGVDGYLSDNQDTNLSVIFDGNKLK